MTKDLNKIELIMNHPGFIFCLVLLPFILQNIQIPIPKPYIFLLLAKVCALSTG